jgi:hypothetical protein
MDISLLEFARNFRLDYKAKICYQENEMVDRGHFPFNGSIRVTQDDLSGVGKIKAFQLSNEVFSIEVN